MVLYQQEALPIALYQEMTFAIICAVLRRAAMLPLLQASLRRMLASTTEIIPYQTIQAMNA
jgi:hypothetical protein